MQTARPGTSRQLPALQASPQPDGPATALSINCKTALCIWDVENVPPFHPVSSAPVQLLRIQVRGRASPVSFMHIGCYAPARFRH